MTPESTPQLIRVALVDDHFLLLHALGEALANDEDFEVVLLHDGSDGVLDALSATGPDVVLLDLTLGTTDGLDVLDQLCERLPAAATVVLSGRQEARLVAAAIERGAAGFLGKSAPLHEVRSAIRQAAQGRTVLPRSRLTEVVKALTADEEHERRLGTFLTPREKSILSRLAAGHSTARIAKDLAITHHTVRTHIQNVLTKLGAHSKLEAAAIGMRAEIVTPYEEPAAGGSSQVR